MTQETSAKTQYLGTFFATLVVMGYGAVCGWPSPAFPILQSAERTPLKSGVLNNNEVSWVGSIMCPGGLLGTLICGWMCEKFGRKISICSAALPQIVSWVLIMFGTDVKHLYISRFLAGFSGGVAFVAVPIFIAEIAETRIRGLLGSMLVFSANFGIFFAYSAGAYLDYQLVPLIYLIFPAGLLMGFYFLPETPSYLAKSGKYLDAEESLRFYRGLRRGTNSTDIISEELAALKEFSVENDASKKTNEKITRQDFATKHAKRAMAIGICLMVLNQFCGCFAMLNYTATIFEAAGSTLSPNASAIIVGFIQIVGSYFPTLLADRAGRKFCIAISAIGISLGLAVLGTYTYLDSTHVDVSNFKWVPLVAFSFVIFIASWGVLTLPFLVISEIMPEKIKAFSSTLCMSILWICAFIAIKLLPTLIVVLKMHGTMYMFSMISFIGFILVLILQPETKGKTFAEISEILGK